MPKGSEELRDILTRRQVFLERHKSQEITEFAPFLEVMREDILSTLSRKNISTARRSRLQDMLDTLSDSLSGTFADYEKVWLNAMKELSIDEARFNTEAINLVTDLSVTAPTPLQLESAMLSTPLHITGKHGGSLVEDFFTDITQGEVNRVTNAIKLGFAQGESVPQVATRILGTAAAKFKDGSIAQVERAAEMVARTGLTQASATARQRTFDRNKVVKGVEWISTLDSRTSNICKSLDGQIYPKDKGPRPPIHVACRSTIGPAFDERFQFLNEGATRSSRDPDGKVRRVDANMTYYDWLKTQNKDFQEAAIGKKWTKLLNEGGLSSERFAELRLDKTFAPITLEEARKLDPVAFARAGLDKTVSKTVSKTVAKTPVLTIHQRAIDHVQNIGKNRGIESAFIYNEKTGEEIFNRRGTKESVFFTDDDISKMNGNVIVHNHPFDIEVSLSRADFNTSAKVKAARIIAVSPQGTQFVGKAENRISMAANRRVLKSMRRVFTAESKLRNVGGDDKTLLTLAQHAFGEALRKAGLVDYRVETPSADFSRILDENSDFLERATDEMSKAI